MIWAFVAVFGLMLILLGIGEWRWRVKWNEWTKERAAIRAELDSILTEMKRTVNQLQVKIAMDSVDLTKLPSEFGLSVQYGQMSIPVNDVHPYLDSFEGFIYGKPVVGETKMVNEKIRPEDIVEIPMWYHNER